MTSPTNPTVAYFCMEFGLSPALPIYSGGLGVLAGDILKSAGDLGKPMIGVGLLWNEGYCQQTIDDNGKPVDRYVVTPRDSLAAVDAKVEVSVGGKPVSCRAFKVQEHVQVPLYLLEPVEEADRWITQRLYGGGAEDRLAQEIVLGVGGVRLLQALGIEPDYYHFNDGHPVLAGLELVRTSRKAGASLSEAVDSIRRRIIFTTHTPVKAGNESHPIELMERMGANVGMEASELASIGGDPFGMTVAGLKLSCRANGVAELHGETARTMWSGVDNAAPILSITNGVHVPTWQDASIRDAVSEERPAEQRTDALWAAHQQQKADLIELIATRTGQRLSADQLLIGFARRAAPYKRADLILRDSSRLESLLDSSGLQIVFAGKAHPADTAGKEIIEKLVTASRRWADRIVYLENYDMTLGSALTRGCDVWLNNPRRPLEASGTSGMKAAMNGVLNCSILDGWWPEGCRHGVTGWQIGGADDSRVEVDEAEQRAQDQRDLNALFSVLSDEVVPTYRDNRPAWIAMMRASISMSQWAFSADRMVEDYYRLLYKPE